MKTGNKRVVISLFDSTGIMVEPWLEAGAECWIVDDRHLSKYCGDGVFVDERGIRCVNHDLSTPWFYPGDKSDVVMTFAFPPHDNRVFSGSLRFRGKALRQLMKNIEFFTAAVEFCEWAGAPYLIECPEDVVSAHWMSPGHILHPFQYAGCRGSNGSTRRIRLWTGNDFRTPMDLLWRGRGESDHHTRPESPRPDPSGGMAPKEFARAVFEANKHLLGDKNGRVIYPQFPAEIQGGTV